MHGDPLDHKSNVPGVSWHAPNNKWQARITKDHVTYFLGYFDQFEDAARVRHLAEQGQVPLNKRQKRADFARKEDNTNNYLGKRKMSKKAASIQIGHTYEGLTPLRLYWDDTVTPACWMAECRCEYCTRIVPIRVSDLGEVKSCGCQKSGQTEALIAWSKAHNSSGVTGVSWNKRSRKWEAVLKCKGVRYYLGRYDSMDAARVVRAEAERHRDDIDEWYKQFVVSQGIQQTKVPVREYKPRASSRGGKHGKVWFLRAPDGQIITVKNLAAWCTKNEKLFDHSKTSIYQTFLKMATQLRRGEQQISMQGWTLEKQPEYIKSEAEETAPFNSNSEKKQILE